MLGVQALPARRVLLLLVILLLLGIQAPVIAQSPLNEAAWMEHQRAYRRRSLQPLDKLLQVEDAAVIDNEGEPQ